MRIFEKLKAFTLTELLLAIAIVGVIAALILPAAVSKFNDKLVDNSHDRLQKSISTTVNSLAVSENKISFNATMLHLDDDDASKYADSSGKFLKKYLRVSKYCGESNGDCFAKEYYQYVGKQKQVYAPPYIGGCAILKNGASICLKPHIGTDTVINALIDVNGPKGPNVLDRDLRFVEIDAPIQQAKGVMKGDVKTEKIVNFEQVPPPPNVCEENPDSVDCCRTLDPETFVMGAENNRCCFILPALDRPEQCMRSDSEPPKTWSAALECRFEGKSYKPGMGMCEESGCYYNVRSCKVVTNNAESGYYYSIAVHAHVYRYDERGGCYAPYDAFDYFASETSTEVSEEGKVYGYSDIEYTLYRSTTPTSFGIPLATKKALVGETPGCSSSSLYNPYHVIFNFTEDTGGGSGGGDFVLDKPLLD